jgi:hypothetical protein
VNDPAVFKENVIQYSYGNFHPYPRGKQPSEVHSQLFCFWRLGKTHQDSLVRILGSRSPPFKSLNIDHVVKQLTEPRTTRTLESMGDELWLPTMEEFLGCEKEEAFRDLTSVEEE